jgi:Ca2+-binding EF-hand superfamily protein
MGQRAAIGTVRSAATGNDGDAISPRTRANSLEIIMKAHFSKTLMAASLCAFGVAAASAAPAGAPSGDPAPQTRECCKQDSAACREHARARFEARFKRLDTDGDGTVSKAEAEKGPPHLAEHFAEIDANKDGNLTQEEMLSAMRTRMARCTQDPDGCQGQMKQRFEGAWKRADVDGDGSLSKAEAEQGMSRLARHFDQIDTDRDGKITLAETDAARPRHRHPCRVPKPDASPSSAPQTNS